VFIVLGLIDVHGRLRRRQGKGLARNGTVRGSRNSIGAGTVPTAHDAAITEPHPRFRNARPPL